MAVGIPEMGSQQLVVPIGRHRAQLDLERNPPPGELIVCRTDVVFLKDDFGQRGVTGNFVDLIQHELDTTTIQECETPTLAR